MAGTRRLELITAATENKPNMILTYIKESGRVEDIVGEESRSLLHIAAWNGSADVLELFLRSPRLQKKVNSRDRGKRTPLHLAAAKGYETCVKALLDAQATPDMQDMIGCTPLHLSLRFEWLEASRLLLVAGADPLLEDQQGATSADIASDSRVPGIVELLAPWAGQRRGGLGGLSRSLLQLKRLLVGKSSRSRPPLAQGQLRNTAQVESLEEGRLGDLETTIGARMEEMSPTSDDVPRRPVVKSSKKRPETTNSDPVLVKGRAVASPQRNVASTAPNSEFAVYRIHAFFGDQVHKLEFEVAWKDQQPSVGVVKPAGAAEQRGIVFGDRLVEIAGIRTTGRGREELLPLLKKRPLLLKIDREAHVEASDPSLELDLCLSTGKDNAGLAFQYRSSSLMVASVKANSQAAHAGFIEGDSIIRVDGHDVSKQKSLVLEDRPCVVTLLRQPVV